jgi:hypothetical protein
VVEEPLPLPQSNFEEVCRREKELRRVRPEEVDAVAVAVDAWPIET